MHVLNLIPLPMTGIIPTVPRRPGYAFLQNAYVHVTIQLCVSVHICIVADMHARDTGFAYTVGFSVSESVCVFFVEVQNVLFHAFSRFCNSLLCEYTVDRFPFYGYSLCHCHYFTCVHSAAVASAPIHTGLFYNPSGRQSMRLSREDLYNLV